MRILALVSLPLLFASAGCERTTAVAAPAPKAAADTQPADAVLPRSSGPGDGRKAEGVLAVILDGKPGPTWSPEQVTSGPRLALTNKNGEARDAWSVRELVSRLLGPGARVAALVDGSGERLEISPAEWGDAQKALVLRVSNRGGYKAHWTARNGSAGDAILRDVRKLEIASK